MTPQQRHPFPFGDNVTKLSSTSGDFWQPFVCGHCGSAGTAAVLAIAKTSHDGTLRWLQCPGCGLPSAEYPDRGGIVRVPGELYGPEIEGLPDDVAAAYDEARSCLSVNAFTAAEQMCRKILMHVAVDKGAKEKSTFSEFIDHLAKEGYVTPPMAEWVKLIKDHGNAANHKIAASDRARAQGTLQFTAQLLRSTYEMAFLAKKFTPVPKPAK